MHIMKGKRYKALCKNETLWFKTNDAAGMYTRSTGLLITVLMYLWSWFLQGYGSVHLM